ncbi:GH25 family lysozyme [Bacillus sp. CGMCC 1.16607]|uniref:GH25 family lysozyme n=1 Tax=Bacillus sp. CGMCC 1.16607 TaxID=3351842 RepID=UPI0036361798
MVEMKGIDVSHWNGEIDWVKVAADGVKFVFIKATEGTSYSRLSYFKENAPLAQAAGIKVGAYHYAQFSTVAQARVEAAYFLQSIKGITLDYPAVLDLEVNKGQASKATLTSAAIAFLDMIKNAGYTPMLYTGKSFLENQLDESMLEGYPLWVARYNNTLGRNADIWQHTDSGKVSGIKGNVDMNIAYREFSNTREVSKASSGDSDLYRLVTGNFGNKSNLAAGKKRIQQKYKWIIYEKIDTDYRLVTGTFKGKEAAEERAANIRKAFGWTVYVQEA